MYWLQHGIFPSFVWLAALVALAVWAIRKVNSLISRVDEHQSRIWILEREIRQLQKEIEARAKLAPPAAETHPPPGAPPVPAAAAVPPVIEAPAPAPQPVAVPPVYAAPPVLPVEPPAKPVERARESAPPPPVIPPVPEAPAINWENFLGVKLFAWVGGLIAFLAVAFFVKYSFDNNLVSPAVRIAIGFLVGLGALVGGLMMSREKYAVMVQALCSAGILILYGDIFASHSLYKFIGTTPTFLLMVLVTAAAFLLAVRMEAQVVAVLGLIGGFLTPPLLSTGVDNPVGLFTYVAVLDAGLIAVALRQRWNHLVFLAALATVFMQLGWMEKFFEAPKVVTAMNVFGDFTLFFVLTFLAAHRLKQADRWVTMSAVMMPFVALGFVFYLLVHPYPSIAAQPGLLFTYLFLIDLAFLVLVWFRDRLRPLLGVAGMVVFGLMAIWTMAFATMRLLDWALGFYLLFTVLHGVFPVVLQRLRPETPPAWWAHLFPPVALLLVMVPVLKYTELSFLVWPCILLVDVVAIVLGALTASLLSIVWVLILTLVVIGLSILRVPVSMMNLSEELLLVGGFSIFFFAIGIWAARKIVPRIVGGETAGAVAPSSEKGSELMVQIPAMSAILPFLLLIMISLKLPMADPSPLFGLAALLLILVLGVARIYWVDALTAVGLAALLGLEYVWHFQRFDPTQATIPLLWYLGFLAVFLAYPFVFRKEMEARVLPWVVAVLAGPIQFYLVYRLVGRAVPGVQSYLGLLPALFAVPYLAGLVYLVKTISAENPARNTLLALFGGVALFFITLIFPIQFEKQWLTVAWALEGVALFWLFHRVPHNGLRIVGCALLVVAFARLALNPAVFSYHPRSATPIWNWYLYAYGITTICLLAGPRLIDPPHHQVMGINAPPILRALGVVLAFLLLNIEIADYFSKGRSTITFQFSGDVGQDMTYSIAWALFALVLLVVGIRRELAAARYSGLGLLTVTLVKLFLHDLWRLGGLYRIGSLIGLAVVLLLVSFIYQQFLAKKKAKAGN